MEKLQCVRKNIITNEDALLYLDRKKNQQKGIKLSSA